MNGEYDYIFKIVTIGNAGVGKSSLLIRLIDDCFGKSNATIGLDYRDKILQIDGKSVRLQIWDTAGQEQYQSISRAYYKGAHGIVMVYDVTNPATFEDIDRIWIKGVENHANQNAKLLLVGSKNDIVDDKRVSTDMGRDYAISKNMQFAEASAKTSEQVNAAFTTFVRELMKKNRPNFVQKTERQQNREEVRVNHTEQYQNARRETSIQLNNKPNSQANQEQKKGCC